VETCGTDPAIPIFRIPFCLHYLKRKIFRLEERRTFSDPHA